MKTNNAVNTTLKQFWHESRSLIKLRWKNNLSKDNPIFILTIYDGGTPVFIVKKQTALYLSSTLGCL
jgi:hypothetical protein